MAMLNNQRVIGDFSGNSNDFNLKLINVVILIGGAIKPPFDDFNGDLILTSYWINGIVWT